MTVLRCLLTDESAPVGDIEVSYDELTTVASFLAALPVNVGGRPVYVGQTMLDPELPMGESGLTQGCQVSIGAPAPAEPGIPTTAVGVVQILTGPDAGSWTWLHENSGCVVGRSTGCQLTVNDPEVSRQHASLSLNPANPAEALVHDLGSANGTRVGASNCAQPTPLAEGATVQIGNTHLTWYRIERVSHDWRTSGDGRVDFTRRFHHATAHTPRQVDLPAEPANTSRNLAMALLSVGTPLLMGLAMFATSRNPMYLMMTLLSPLMLGVQQFLERRSRKQAHTEYEQRKADATTALAAAVTDEEQLRRLYHPDPLLIRLSAIGARPGLWTTHASGVDALHLRVGTLDEPAAVTVNGQRWKDWEPPQVVAVPATVDLRSIGVLSVTGPPQRSAGLVRWLLIQLAVRRTPDDLKLYLMVAGTGEHLRWARWLPHLAAEAHTDIPARVACTAVTREAMVKELSSIVTQREAALREAGAGIIRDNDVVVLLDGAHELRTLAGMRAVLTRGPAVGVYTIAVDHADINECTGVVRLLEDGQVEIVGQRELPASLARAETLRTAEAESLARQLAPLRDRAFASATEGAIPYPVRLLDLMDLHIPTAADVTKRWAQQAGPTTHVPLGADAHGAVCVDIAAQGPHIMLGGTTGAGKSYLLQALLASLLTHNNPDELNLLLVDFKGGAAFLPFVEFPGASDAERLAQAQAAGRSVRCPHVVGLIRSSEDDPTSTFDQAAADRVLASIKAEVTRRERILARYGGEIEVYLRERPVGSAPLPRLLMVFDEYARVLDAAPGFIQQLVNVAGKGRSLGMHVLLATQSLQGKLTPELKNNIDLRISLRQNQKDDSIEILDAPDAATIPGRLRGRGYVVARKDDPPLPRAFQTGHLGAPPPSNEPPPASVRLVNWLSLGLPRPVEAPLPSDEPTDQDLLLAAIEQASTDSGCAEPFRPLLPALPASLTLDDLENVATQPCPPRCIPFGLRDEPDFQAQPMQVLPLDAETRLMLAGGTGAGRTTAIETLIQSAVSRFSPDEVHLYVVEREPSGLATYETLPHCGGVFGPGEPDRIRRFVTWLAGEVESRRLSTTTGPGPDHPRLVTFIDGWEHFYDPTDPTSMETTLVRMLREIIKNGPRVGIHVVVTCDRAPLMSKPGDLFDTRLVLRFPQADVVRSVVPSGTALPLPIPGRAVNAATGRHCHLATPSRSAVDAVMTAQAQWGGRCVRPPTRFLPLPTALHLSDCPPARTASPTWISLGVGGPDLAPIGIDLFAGPQTLVVSGAAGAGRSNAAALVATQLAAAGVGCLVLTTPRSPLVEWLAGVAHIALMQGPTITDDALRVAADALPQDRKAVIVDDCELISVTPTSQSFDELPTLLADATTPEFAGRLGLVLCGNVLTLLENRRSLSPVARRATEEGMRVLIGRTAPLAAREFGFMLELDELTSLSRGRGYTSAGRGHDVIQLAVWSSTTSIR